MDVMMPIMDGLVTTQKIKALGYTGLIIGYSSMYDKVDISKGLGVGMAGYFNKSAHTKLLLKLLYELDILEEPEDD